MKSVMKHQFSQVPRAEIQRSSFNRSHGCKTTMDSGWLVPVYVDEVLPGDTFNLNMTAFARMATPIFPIMDNLYLDSFFFAVPIRLIWDNWEKFNGAQDDPGDSISFTIPTSNATASTGYQEMSLQDYMGIPTEIADLTHNALHTRAYNLIWNQWFRDENLQDSITVDKGNGPDTVTNYVLQRRGKRHDYFTSSLPWPQKGATPVSLPLGTSAPVTTAADAVDELGVISTTQSNLLKNMSASGSNLQLNTGTVTDALYADLSNATAATINQLRTSFQIQKLLERDARGGTRYTEIIKAHFGVTSPDARLQRAEFLGGGSTPVNISAIPQTSSTDGTSPQGNLAAMGTVEVSGHGFTKSFTEHCVLIGLVSIRADLNYQQGLNRMWSRQTRYDFYWPAFANIGEQTVLNKEIYAQGPSNPASNELVFGYQERYAEYRYKPSQITGLFRSSATGTLEAWHLAQDFSTLPLLNASFIVDNPPVDRVIATPAEPHFIFDSYFSLRCARPMPVYGVPGLIDHF